MFIKKAILFSFVFFVYLNGKSQVENGDDSNDDIEFHPVYFTVNGGAFHASKKTAIFYNGLGDNNISRVLGIQQIYDQVFNKIGYTFSIGEYPANVRYRIGLNLGIEGGIWLSEYTAFTFGADFQKLSINEVFTLNVQDPANPFGDDLIYPQQILANEQRFQFNLGLHHDVGDSYKAMTFFEWGANYTALKVLKHEILIEETLRYSLLYQVNQFEIRNLTGSGIGAFAAFGVRMGFEKNLALDIGLRAYFQRIKFNEQQYSTFSELLFLRLVYL